jgi:hypothetical protein
VVFEQAIFQTSSLYPLLMKRSPESLNEKHDQSKESVQSYQVLLFVIWEWSIAYPVAT